MPTNETEGGRTPPNIALPSTVQGRKPSAGAELLQRASKSLKQRFGRRYTGTGPDGSTRVDNVTEDNRYDLISENKPELVIELVESDGGRRIGFAVIPNTRESPDVVMFKGEPYEVLNSTLAVPKYQATMFVTAKEVSDKPPPSK